MTGMSREEKLLVRVLSEPLPMSPRPFAEVAAQAGMTEDAVLEKIREWRESGVIRRFGARVKHHKIGFTANGMSAWIVPPEKIEEVGRIMADQPEVSHCYSRKTAPEWPYNMYAMIHGTSKDEVAAVAERISARTGLTEYDVLFSVRELKKSAPKFGMEGD